MSTTEVRSGAASAKGGDIELAVVVIPVSDVDRASASHASLGRRADADFADGQGFRVVLSRRWARHARSGSAPKPPARRAAPDGPTYGSFTSLHDREGNNDRGRPGWCAGFIAAERTGTECP